MKKDERKGNHKVVIKQNGEKVSVKLTNQNEAKIKREKRKSRGRVRREIKGEN